MSAIIAEAICKGVYDAGIGFPPRHADENGNTYMVRISDDGEFVIVMEDVWRNERDALERQIALLEDYMAQISPGESPKLVDQDSRWYDKMKVEIERREKEVHETGKRIAEMKGLIASNCGLRTYEFRISQFKGALISFDILGAEVDPNDL